MHAATTTELLEACTILFGEKTAVSPAFLKILRPSGLRSAYRQRVLETHPDRALHLGVDEAVLGEAFKRLNRAYTCLQSMVQGHWSPAAAKDAGHHGKRRPSARATTGNRFYDGPLPRRPLPLGQFLYYSGIISWQSLMQAIIWQRSSRMRIGDLARQSGLLSKRHVQRVLRVGPASARFGERALRMGYLTPFQVLALLGQQKKRRVPIGRYFLREKLLTAPALARHLKAHRLHNERYRPATL